MRQANVALWQGAQHRLFLNVRSLPKLNALHLYAAMLCLDLDAWLTIG